MSIIWKQISQGYS